MSHPSAIANALAAKRGAPEAVVSHIRDGDDVIVGAANAEPVTIVDAIEGAARPWTDVRLHQMLPLRGRRYIEGAISGLRHVSWFLSPPTRDAFHKGTCDLVPNNFSEVPLLMKRATKCSLLIVATAPPDRHGYFSLGAHGNYVAAMIGRVQFFIEVNRQMPRTFGANQVHVSQIEAWCEADYPLVEVPNHPTRDIDARIAALVTERIPDGATLQVGIGAVPAEVLKGLTNHRELGVHTELFGPEFVDLVERGVITGTRKRTHPQKIIASDAMGDRRLYEFVDENPGIEFWPVSYTNDPRKIACEPNMVSINATLEVDFLGQCASESLGSTYWSSSGGQTDFARGATFAEHGLSFIVLHSTTADESVSRIVPQLHPGAAVTTYKNIIDRVVTEYGVAELRGSSIRERTRRLIAIAHPRFREALEAKGREIGYL